MGVKWTEQQQKVIDLRNRNILVSAAAGSGKTAVLVERIIQKITDEQSPVDVDRLLIVTFTEAAAAEMKDRIREGPAVLAGYGREHGRRGVGRLYGLKIAPTCVGKTYHSFSLPDFPLETPPHAWGRRSYGQGLRLARRNTPTCVGKTAYS